MICLAPETIADKVYAITRACQDKGFLSRIELTALEDTLTSIVEDDFLDVVVQEEIINDTINVNLSLVCPSERGKAVLERYAELSERPIIEHDLNIPAKWKA